MKPCPFCDSWPPEFGSPFVDIAGREDGFAVGCEKCGAIGPTGKNTQEAEALWNQRSPLAPPHPPSALVHATAYDPALDPNSTTYRGAGGAR